MLVQKTTYILSILLCMSSIAVTKTELSKENVSQVPLNALLLMAIEAQNCAEVNKMLAKGAQANALIQEIRPLHLALTHGSKDIVQSLLDAGALVNETIYFNEKQYTALELLKWNIEQSTKALEEYAQDLAQLSSTLVKDKEHIEKVSLMQEAYNRYKAKLEIYQQLLQLLEVHKVQEDNYALLN